MCSNTSTFGILRRQLGQIRADVVALAVELVTANTGGGFEELLADGEVVGSMRQVHHIALQIVQLPVGVAAEIFQEIVFHLQLVGGKVRSGIGFVGFQIRDDVECSIHATPVSRIRANVRIDSRLLRHFEEDGIRLLRLNQFAGDQEFCRSSG